MGVSAWPQPRDRRQSYIAFFWVLIAVNALLLDKVASRWQGWDCWRSVDGLWLFVVGRGDWLVVGRGVWLLVVGSGGRLLVVRCGVRLNVV
jgi:hypothetical protein